MRIISSFHDYYDGVGSVGGYDTEGRVWVRQTQEPEADLQWKDLRPFLYSAEMLAKVAKTPWRVSDRHMLGDYVRFQDSDRRRWAMPERFPVWVGIAGRIYRGFYLQEWNQIFDRCASSGFVWSLDQALAFLDRYEYSDENPARNPQSWEFLDVQGTEAVEVFRAHDVATFARLGTGLERGSDRVKMFGLTSQHVTIDPVLKDLDFASCLDAWTIYQELDMFVSNLLIPSDPPNPTLTEGQFVQQKGFDPKYGFRKRPE